MSEDMLEDVSCPSCGVHFRVRHAQLGMKGKCKCGHSFALRACEDLRRKDELSDDDILATLSEGPPTMPHLNVPQTSWQTTAGQEPASPLSAAHPKQRSAVGKALIERTSETGRQIPRYRTLKAMGLVFRIAGLVSAVLAVLGLVLGLSYLYDRPFSTTALATATTWSVWGVALFIYAILSLGIAEAIFAFRDLVINSWIALER